MDQQRIDEAVLADKVIEELRKVAGKEDNSLMATLDSIVRELEAQDVNEPTYERFTNALMQEADNDLLCVVSRNQIMGFLEKYGNMIDTSHSHAKAVIASMFDKRGNLFPRKGDVVEVRQLGGKCIVEASPITEVRVEVTDDGEITGYKTELGGDKVYRVAGATYIKRVKTAEQGEHYTGQMVEVRDVSGTHVLIPASPVISQTIKAGGENLIQTEKSKMLRGLGSLSDKEYTFTIV